MKSNEKFLVVLLGPSPNRIGGVATHIEGLMSSDLTRDFTIKHLGVGIDNSNGRDSILQSVKRVIHLNLRLYSLVKSSGGRVVHLNTSMDSRSLLRDGSFILTSKLADAKVFLQFHGGRINRIKALRIPILKWALKNILLLSDEIVVRSKQQKESLQKLYPDLNPKIIPNFINTSIYQCDETQTKANKGLRLLFLGRIIKEKGIYETIEAFRSCIKDFPHLRLRIAGTGDELDNARKLCEKLRLKQKVDFLGFITGEKKIQTYLNSDIFLFPTYWPEGFPYVITEAMAAGLPIIASPSGAISEIIEDGVNGFLVPPKDPTALTEKLRLLIEHTELRRRMGKNNVEKVKAEYSWGRGIEVFTSIYRQLLQS